ncbi:MAG: hypothetical protein PVJ39_04860 [Gammaproteobacteria bacterium]|jgi:hypothetical protein
MIDSGLLDKNGVPQSEGDLYVGETPEEIIKQEEPEYCERHLDKSGIRYIWVAACGANDPVTHHNARIESGRPCDCGKPIRIKADEGDE